MKCAACGYEASINSWMTVNEPGTEKTSVAPRVTYYTRASRNQNVPIYACPKCGTLRIRKLGER